MKNYLAHLHHWGKYNLDVVAVRHLYILQELAEFIIVDMTYFFHALLNLFVFALLFPYFRFLGHNNVNKWPTCERKLRQICSKT
jgi:hypothetical protein